MFGMLSVLAELQRALIVANTRHGLRPESTRQHYEARAGSLADPVRMASRSLSESPPQTPWGSGAANA